MLIIAYKSMQHIDLDCDRIILETRSSPSSFR